MTQGQHRLILAVATAAAGILFSGAPAPASAGVPEVSSFSQALAGTDFRASGRAGEAAVHRSAVLSAPRRFDLAGLSGVLRETELRARAEGGEWTDWTESANGDPVWFGGMDELQVRARGWRPSGTIGYARVTKTGSAPAAERGSDSDRPRIVSRRDWGANKRNGKGCEPRKRPDIGVVKAASVHHTVSAVNYSEREAPGMVLAICRFHRNDNGWDDIGYNAIVDQYGNIYEGRDGGLGKAVQGAHAEGVNSQTTGVAMLGTHTNQPVSRKAFGGLAQWLAWKLPHHGHEADEKTTLVSRGGGTALYPNGTRFRVKRIIGHRDTNQTECPGGALYHQLPELRKKVQKKIDG